MTECGDVRVALGPLAVGALEPDEERRIREHATQCPECAREMDELAETVAALSLVDADEIEAPVEPSPDLLHRLLARVAAARRRRRLVAVAGAAAAAVIAGAAGLALGTQETGQPPAAADPTAADPTAADPAVSVSGSDEGIAVQIDAWDKGWGTAVQAEISGVPSGYRCSLVAVGSDGSREVAATWVVPNGGYGQSEVGQLSVDGAVALRSWDVDRYEVVTLDGETLVTAAHSDSP